MKQLSKKIFSGFLLLCLLTGSVGMPLVSHTCILNGKKQVSILPAKDCCKTKKHGSTQELSKSSCCLVSAEFFKVETPAIQKAEKFTSSISLTAIVFILISGLSPVVFLLPITVSGSSPPRILSSPVFLAFFSRRRN